MGNKDLGGPDGFLARVEVLYRALALDSRALVVGGVEAGLTDPAKSVEHFHRDLEHRLAENARHMRRLRDALANAARVRVTCNYLLSSAATERRVVRIDRLLAELAQAVSAPAPAPALLTPTNQLIIEAKRSAKRRVARSPAACDCCVT